MRTGVQTIDYTEKKSNKKRYVMYPTVIQLENGNIVLVKRVEYFRDTQKLSMYYEDDTEELKKTVELLSNYYKFMEIYRQTGNQSAMTQAAAYLMKLNDIYPDFDIISIEQNKQTILNNYNNPDDLEQIVNTTKLHPTIIKAILILNNKLKVNW